LPYEITLITNNLPLPGTYNCWKKDYFQQFKTWKLSTSLFSPSKTSKWRTIY
jgi:hypothetical protein